MTKIPIDAAPAGPELDIAVALELGHNVVRQTDPDRWLITSDGDALRFGINSGMFENVTTGPEGVIEREYCLYLPRYSANIDAAWELAEDEDIALIPVVDGWFARLDKWSSEPKQNRERVLYSRRPDRYYWGWWETDLGSADGSFGDIAPLAIVRAFLKAKGVTEIEILDETDS